LIALFPLRSVLFPGALLQLKVFEARYLDLVGRCLRERERFGVVCLAEGRESGREGVRFETEGTMAHIEEVDAEGTNLLRVRCRGAERFRIVGQARVQPDGLWVADVQAIAADASEAPLAEFAATVQALQQVIASLKEQGNQPFAEPFHLGDAGWVANRWCEILPISLAAKHKLMTLEDPQTRLRLVHEYLKGKGVVQ
jgi:Lon protease-like protein